MNCILNIRKILASISLVLFFTQGMFADGVDHIDAARVRLLPGSTFFERQELHRNGYLRAIEPDKLLFHYRTLAGLPQPEGVKGAYGGWDSGFILGHMAGHYLSAASHMAAATDDASFREKMNYMVAELAKYQVTLNQDSYLAAFPSHERKAFNGLSLVIVKAKFGQTGEVIVTAKSEGLSMASTAIQSK